MALDSSKRSVKKLHQLSGIIISIYVGLHLVNHCYSVLGAEKHIELMSTFRILYRNIFIETLLLIAVANQIYSGLKLFIANRKIAHTFFEKLPIYSGLYLAVFLVIHVSAVLVGRLLLNLDTNFYFGVAGLNHFPTNLFFIPYYALAIISFFGHIAAVHNKKMKRNIYGITPIIQAKLILYFGCGLTILIFFGLTNQFRGVQIPQTYHILLGL